MGYWNAAFWVASQSVSSGDLLEGVRGTLDKGMDKVTDLVGKAVAVEGIGAPATEEGATKTPRGRTPGAAKDLLEAEAKIDE
ncbi:unnamed protein product, partial [marine sediment metagenome]